MNSIKQGMFLFLLTFAFWGILYPQFSLVKETYECVEQEKDPKEDFIAILNAGPGEIQIKCRLWEMLKGAAEKN